MTEEQLRRRRERVFVLEFLKRGGVLIREDIGGVVGVRWGRAHRSGPPFDTETCERLLERGCTVDGLPQVLRNAPGWPSTVYHLVDAPPRSDGSFSQDAADVRAPG